MITKEENKKLSKFLSYVLRHHPEVIQIQTDQNGWTGVGELLENLNNAGYQVNFEILEYLVDSNEKKRFSFNENKTLIRASQGHSISVDLGYNTKEPPGLLYHGTAIKNLEAIKLKGLLRMERQHVHLSTNMETARQVGQRYGQAVILEIDSGKMFEKGFEFYLSDNGVWLTESVPPEFIK